MRRSLLAITLGMLAMTAHAQVTPEAARATATALLDHLDRGEFTQAEALFDDAMRAAVPQATLEQVWTSLSPAATRGAMRLQSNGGTHIIYTPLKRSAAEFNAIVSIAADGRVSGLLVKPVEVVPSAPAVPTDAAFTEQEAKVGDGANALPATLAMPKGNGPFPAVVLVHGSGPNDRDETIHANRPFLDIARGLAAHGIAVLRYDKRTKARPQDYAAGISIDSETTDDALLAVQSLRRTPGIDPERVFVLGHSQGGMLAPRIGTRDARIAGLILLAAPARNLLDILIEQNERLLTMQGALDSDAGRAHMATLRGQIAAIRAGGHSKSTGTPLGLPADYWRSVEAVQQVRDAEKATQPLLILHGGHDIQVVDADWQIWRTRFGGDARATLKHYPTLKHLAMPSAANAGLESYKTPSHVDSGLINDIAAWIKAH